jgi:hypothetical protein
MGSGEKKDYVIPFFVTRSEIILNYNILLLTAYPITNQYITIISGFINPGYPEKYFEVFRYLTIPAMK